MHLTLSLLSVLCPQTDAAAEGATRFVAGEAIVRWGYGLDLDTFGLFRGTWTPGGGANEVVFVAGKTAGAGSIIRTKCTPDPGVTIPGGSHKPVYRLTTDEGKTAWVQWTVRHDLIGVRYLVRVAGQGDVLPAVSDPFCVGAADGITVRFGGDRRFARYRVERRDGVDGRFVERTETAEHHFTDRGCAPGTRYGFRITGVTGTGDEGIPAVVQGTTASRGIRTGRIEVGPEAFGLDLLTGAKAPSGAGDVTFQHGYMQDWEGLYAVPRGDGTGPLAYWDLPIGNGVGVAVLVRVRGGGVARCLLDWDRDRRSGVLTYTVNPDGPTIPRGPTLRRVDGSGVRGPVILNADVAPGWTVEEVVARDLEAGTSRRLPCRNRSAIDKDAGEGRIVEYTAHAVDAHGRSSDQARLTVAMRPAGLRRGVFEFHYRQGFSFLLEKVCEPAAADVVFESCAGGISSVTLRSDLDILSLGRLDPRMEGPAARLFRRLQAVDPERYARSKAREASGDDRRPASDVFVLRTRRGGWVKLAIVARKEQGAWTTNPVTVHWVHNPDAPVFVTGARAGFDQRGLALGPDAAAPAPPPVRVERVELPRRPAVERGPRPEFADRQEVLFDRDKHRSYERATFSFEYGSRTQTPQIRNDWEIQLSRDELQVRMVVDDISTIVDLGDVPWGDLSPQNLVNLRWKDRVPVVKNHVYLVHTVDSESDHYALFRILEHTPGDRATLTWITLLGQSLKHAPDFPEHPATRKKIQALLRQLASGGARSGVGRYYRQPVWASLWKPADGEVRTTAGYRTFFADLAERLDAEVVLDPGVAKLTEKPPKLDGAQTWFDVLDRGARHARLHWFIDGKGRIAVTAAR